MGSPGDQRLGAVSVYDSAKAILNGNANDSPSLPPPPLPAGSRTISLKRLSHLTSGKAFKEYDRAKKARENGDVDKAIASLQKAIEIDPEFIEAVNDLGACYTMKQNFGEAAKYFDRAVQIDSRYWPAYYNLALMGLIQNRLDDAERAARTAVDLDRAGSSSRLLLGLALVFQNKFTDEAVTSLEKARDQFPQAHLGLARVLAARGKKHEAKAELETYLAGRPTFGKELAQSWLKVLNR